MAVIQMRSVVDVENPGLILSSSWSGFMVRVVKVYGCDNPDSVMMIITDYVHYPGLGRRAN